MTRKLISLNPATEEVLRRLDPHSDDEVQARLGAAAAAFPAFRRLSIAERARMMLRLAENLETGKLDHARLMTLEMGKLLKAAVQEVEKCVFACRWYADNAARLLETGTIDTENATNQVRCEPLGPILAIMPWNFPFWQFFRFAAPALMAGNVILLKHASNVPQCALALEKLIHQAGFLSGVCQTLLVGSDRVNGLIEDHRIRAVTLTGSVAAGQSVAAAAGREIKKSVLELGGSDPFIVMPSADLAKAVETAVRARNINNGQSCIAAKRFILHEKVADEFLQKFLEQMRSLKLGDPADPSTDIGPLATAEVRESLEEQVQKSIAMGARVLLGGKRSTGQGYFFKPTVLADIPPGSPAAEDELFGPVASIFRARSAEEAIGLANQSPFGLGSSVWTHNPAEQQQFIAELEAGAVFINSMVASDPRLPFGGVKKSGYGRELGREGIREFLNLKTVSIRRAPSAVE